MPNLRSKMEARSKNIQIKVVLNFLGLNKEIGIFKLNRKTKNTILVTFLILILVGVPIGIEYILRSSYMVSFFTIVVIYPFLFMVYKMNKKIMNCKYMP
jgi:hypothetical protein